MNERVKIFNYITGSGETPIATKLEDHVNEWLASVPGKLVSVSQSESNRNSGGQHVTLCVWYEPATDAVSSPS